MYITKNELKTMKDYITAHPINGVWMVDNFLPGNLPRFIGQFSFDSKGWIFPLDIHVVNGTCYPGASLELAFPTIMFGPLTEKDLRDAGEKYVDQIPVDTFFACNKSFGNLFLNVFLLKDNCTPKEMRQLLQMMINLNNDITDMYMKKAWKRTVS